MRAIPAEVWATFERRMDEARVSAPQQPDYRKWVRFYLDFCDKYGHLAAPLPSARLPGGQAATPVVPGHGASWEQEYRDLEAAVLMRNYSTRTLEAYRFWVVHDLQIIQKLLEHSDIKTTMIHLQTVPAVTLKEARSPLDLDPSLAPCPGQPAT